jgi:hypothetical protein
MIQYEKEIRKHELTCFTCQMAIYDEPGPSGKGSIFDYGERKTRLVSGNYITRGAS